MINLLLPETGSLQISRICTLAIIVIIIAYNAGVMVLLP